MGAAPRCNTTVSIGAHPNRVDRHSDQHHGEPAATRNVVAARAAYHWSTAAATRTCMLTHGDQHHGEHFGYEVFRRRHGDPHGAGGYEVVSFARDRHHR